MLFLLAFVLIASFPCSDGYNILFVPMHLTGSHKKSMVPLAHFLADHGHNVTIWNAFFEEIPINSNLVKNIDIIIKTENKLYLEQFVWKNGSALMDAWNSGEIKPWDVLIPWWLDIEICKYTIEQRMDAINKISRQKWDLIIVDLFFAPCGYIIVEKAQAPYAVLSTSSVMPASTRHLAHPLPIPSVMYNTAKFDIRRFWDRVSYVFLWEMVDQATSELLNTLIKWTLTPLRNKFSYQGFDVHSALCISSFPSLWELPRPLVFDLVPGGSMYCKPMKPLPKDYADFVGHSRSKGTILAAFGHIVSWGTTDNETIYTIYNAFKQLSDYRIVWQYDGAPLPPLPNLKMSDWIPQTEILYDSRTKAFISHMGLKSCLEALCAEIPFVALPVYAEQPYMTQLLIGRLKAGSYLNKRKLSTENIIHQILEVVEKEALYKQRVTKLAKLMKDTLISATELAAHRIQFSIRHRQHLEIVKHRGRHLGFMKRWMADIILTATLTSMVAIILIAYLISRTVRFLA